MAVKVFVFGSAGNGKSTLINAFLGRKILPVRMVACTAIICELKYSEKKRAVLHFCNRHFKKIPKGLPIVAAEHIKKFGEENIPPVEIPIKMLKDYLVFSDEGNYAGAGVFKKIELYYPHLLLKSIEFIDTPSVGKLNNPAESEADIFLCVLNAEQFAVSEEMFFVLEQLWDRRKDIFFIINKYDHISSESKVRAQKYVQMKLRAYGSRHIYFVSAKDALNGKLAGNLEMCRISGMEILQSGITSYIKEKKQYIISGKRNSDGEFFSWKNFNEITDLEHHLAFLEMIIDKYRWEEEVKKNLIVRLKRINAKRRDKKLSLSVVGDFSTGKSTFINAILREELLTSGSMQGTTVVSTIIEHSTNYALELHYIDKSEELFPFDDLQGLKEKLAVINPEPAKKLHHVQVYLPSEVLAKDIRIIDTPGTNAIELWHEDVAIRAIHEISDLSIILVNATKVLPESFCTFIENNLSSVLGQCVFVVTKYDLLKEKERDRVLTYIRQKLEKQFGLKNPIVLPYVAPVVIEDCKEHTGFGSNPGLLKVSYESEAMIFKFIEKHRLIAQAKKMVQLNEEVYGLLSEEMKEISASCQNYLEMLRQTGQMDLEFFIAQQRQERSNSFEKAVIGKRAEAVKFMNELSADAQMEIYSKIDRCKTYSALKSYICEKLKRDLIAGLENMIELSGQKFSCIADCFQKEVYIFQEEFKRIYKNLDVLEIDFPEKRYRLPIADELKPETLRSAAEQIVQRAVLKNPFNFYLGAGEGKRIVKERLKLPLCGYFNEVEYNLAEIFDKYCNKAKELIFTEVDRYLLAYRDIAAKRIAEVERRKREMEGRLYAVKKDMDAVEKRKFRMESVKEQLDILGEAVPLIRGIYLR